INSMDRHKTYLITKDESEMNFIQGGYAKVNRNMIAFYLPSLQKKIIDALYTAGKPVIQIDFSNPRNPSMYLYNSIPGDQIQAVKKFVMSQAPFIDDVKFIVYEKKILLTQAEQGLERLNIFFRLVSTTGGYALIVQSSLDDHQLFALNQFIKEFYNQWGNRIINFSISLDENFLHDKSYFESLSGEGYIFLSPHHWFFPLTEEEGYLKND
ncbi:TPA: PrgH/EprH family type III secretion apparatus protein, partial [Salmonella enterica subsp. enterica serovar Grumpensis]